MGCDVWWSNLEYLTIYREYESQEIALLTMEIMNIVASQPLKSGYLPACSMRRGSTASSAARPREISKKENGGGRSADRLTEVGRIHRRLTEINNTSRDEGGHRWHL